MNYLGHLYFSGNDSDLMLANLYGDFVKGKNLDHYHPKIQEGIHLHRKIDSFIDTHPSVTELRLSLYADLPKVAGIAIDLYFDHLLAMKWEEYHAEILEEYLENFYVHQSIWEEELNEHFANFLLHFRSKKWLNHYASDFGLRKLSQGVASKLSFPNQLHTAPELFYKRQKDIENCFELFMSDAISHFFQAK